MSAFAKIKAAIALSGGDLVEFLQLLRLSESALCVRANLLAVDVAKERLAKAFAAHDKAVRNYRATTTPVVAPEVQPPDHIPAFLLRDRAAATDKPLFLLRERPASGPNY